MKRKAHVLTLLALICLPPTWIVLWAIFSGTTPLRSDLGSPLILGILILNLTLLSCTIYFWFREKKNPTGVLKKRNILADRIGQGLLLLLLVVVLFIIMMCFMERNLDFGK